jgi:MFS transporter, MHS family, proline/betaine transporter
MLDHVKTPKEGVMKKLLTKFNIATGCTTVLEWYDFCLYGYFAPLIAIHFFPFQNKTTSLIAAFLAFASAYLVRPLGGLIFGYLGDRLGGGKALYYSIVLIALPTAVVGFLPDYHALGILSPILLLLIRILQGLSAGGQFSNSLALLCEHNHNDYAARSTSLAYIGSISGYFLASMVGFLSLHFIKTSWSWRIPFIIPIFLLPALLYFGRYLKQTDVEPVVPLEHTRIVILFQHWRVLLKGVLLAIAGGVFYASFFVFMVTYLHVYVGLALPTVFWLNAICLVCSAVTFYGFAYLADRWGKGRLLMASSLATLLCLYPAYVLVHADLLIWVFMGMLLLILCDTAFQAAAYPTYVEIFPKSIRFIGCSLVYNIGAGIFAGLTPSLLVKLASMSNPWRIMLLIGLVALMSTAIGFILSRRSTKTLIK